MTEASKANAQFWNQYYEDVAATKDQSWLDYSNAIVQAQTFAFVLESAGEILGRRCVDLGCGRGQLASMLGVLGASEVTGVDAVNSMIQRLADSPNQKIRWLCRDLGDPKSYQSLGPADLVCMVEVMQYLPDEILHHIWDVVAPGGRLVGTVANADCPIVQKTVAKFDGRYVPVTPTHLLDQLESLGALGGCAVRPLAFTSDQRIAPYTAGQWTTSPNWPEPPNRIQFVALKSEA